jgi:vancomycin resistance protein YoaR
LSAENYLHEYGSEEQRRSHDVLAMQSFQGAVEWPAEGGRTGNNASERRARRNTPRRPGAAILLALLALLLLLLLSAGGGLYYLDQRFAGRIYPNISVRGVQIGEMTPSQAQAALQSRYADFLSRPITLTYGGQSWQPTLAELGTQLEIENAVQAALASGRGHGLVDNLWEVAAIWQRGIELPLRLSVDQQAMQRYLVARAAEVERPASDAQLILQGASASTIPSSQGRQVLFDETLIELTAALQTLESQPVALRTRSLGPLLHDEEVAAAQQAAQAILQGPLILEADGNAFEWTVSDLAQLLRIKRVAGADGRDRLELSLDHTGIARRLWDIASTTGRGSVNPRVDWNGGDLQIIKPGKPGLRVDEQRAEEMIRAAVTTPDRLIQLPFTSVRPAANEETLQQLGIKELISVGRSDFTGSAAYRITNIQAGMRLLHGILLEPGEEFSFNDNVGEISAANGFVEGYAIVQNRTQLEYGGGICQDSTTFFRAAFWAGLPITERKEHSFYINWYDKYGLGEENGPGLDATIFTGAQDLKFVNDTGNWLLLQTVVDVRRTLAEVRIYGTKPNRTVELTQNIYDRKPKPPTPVFLPDPEIRPGARRQSDTGRGGMTIDVHRIITENGVRREPELFRTIFRPWPDIYLYNPADLGPDGRPLPQPPAPPEGTQPPPDGTQLPPADGSQPPAPEPGAPPLVEQPPPADAAPPPADGTQPPPAIEPPANG